MKNYYTEYLDEFNKTNNDYYKLNKTDIDNINKELITELDSIQNSNDYNEINNVIIFSKFNSLYSTACNKYREYTCEVFITALTAAKQVYDIVFPNDDKYKKIYNLMVENSGSGLNIKGGKKKKHTRRRKIKN